MIVLLLLCSCEPSTSSSESLSSPKQEEGASQPGPQGPPPVQVESRKIESRPFLVKVSAIGVTNPYREAKVAAAIEGLVTQVFFEEGKEVKENETLVMIEPEIWEARTKAKEAEMKKQEAELERLKSGYLVEEIGLKKASLEEIEAELRPLALEFKRKSDLYHKKNISESEWEQAKFAFEASKARLEKAKADFYLYQKGYRHELIASAKAEWQRSQAEWNEALVYQSKTKILSPFSGQIVEKKIEKGEWVTPGTIIANVMDLSKIKVTLYVAERYIHLVKPGMSAIISIDALPGEEFTGKVIEIVPNAGRDRNFPVRLLVENVQGKIKSGMFCRASAVLKEVEKALMVHCDAILRQRQENTIIKILPDNSIEYVSVIIGDREGDWIEILDSKGKLSAGDRIVVTNNPSVYPGARVIVAREY